MCSIFVCVFFNSKLILERKKILEEFLQFKSNRIKKIFLEVKEF